jgi:hypothetical protein
VQNCGGPTCCLELLPSRHRYLLFIALDHSVAA